MTVFTNRHAFFALFTVFIGTFNIIFFTGFMATNLASNGFNANNVGYVYGSQSFVYLFSCILFHKFSGDFPRKLSFVIAMISLTLIMFLMGPSQILHFPNYNQLIISAFPLLGLIQVLVFIPILPEMIERMQVDLKIVEGQNEVVDAALNDKINDAYGLIYALSNFVSPIIGAALEKQFGQRSTCDYTAFMNLSLGILFFVFNCGPFVFQENKKFNQQLEKLKS